MSSPTNLVKVKQQVSAIRHQEPSLDIDAVGNQVIDLLEESREVHSCAISDHTRGRWVEDTRWDEVERELASSTVVYRVAGIGAALRDKNIVY